ncbi:hypothetical protein BC937DRAFT_94403, partial [Endogone sp. FLAS-F59071]
MSATNSAPSGNENHVSMNCNVSNGNNDDIRKKRIEDILKILSETSLDKTHSVDLLHNVMEREADISKLEADISKLKIAHALDISKLEAARTLNISKLEWNLNISKLEWNLKHTENDLKMANGRILFLMGLLHVHGALESAMNKVFIGKEYAQLSQRDSWIKYLKENPKTLDAFLEVSKVTAHPAQNAEEVSEIILAIYNEQSMYNQHVNNLGSVILDGRQLPPLHI